MMIMAEPSVFAVRGGTRTGKALPWYSLCIAACVYGIAWSVFTWSGPNLRFSALDPNVHHATRVLIILILLLAVAELVTMMRLAVGWLPTALVRVTDSGAAEVAATPWLPGLPLNFNRLTGPVAIEYKVFQGDRQTASRWELWFIGREAKRRVGTIWPLREGDIEALRAQLES